jgi:hypothetical protein
MGILPEVSYGEVGAQPPDWRKRAEPEPDDDEELAETPPDVVEALGFDPLDQEN